ncbi:hypothetical protein MASR1M45_17750 [Candidatus Kapaibacterium sp.]
MDNKADKFDRFRKLSSKERALFTYGAIFYGLLFIIISFTYSDDKDSMILAYAGLFLTIVGIIMAYINITRKKKFQNEQLNKIFYDVVKQNGGKITSFQFAVASNLNPNDAKQFVESKAMEFGVVSEVNDEGIISYRFN